VEITALGIGGAFVCTPRQHPDDRGVFLEWFKAGQLAEAVGHRLRLEQANHSVSARGTLRGIHFADVPPSQAKYVYCPSGAILDVVVDIRVGSPTYGRVEAVRLDEVDRRAVYLSEGLGHAFLALTEGAVATYLCSTGYAPGREHGITPLDPALELPWDRALGSLAAGAVVEPLLSDKDIAAPTLAEAGEQGLLPSYDACLRFYAELRTRDAT